MEEPYPLQGLQSFKDTQVPYESYVLAESASGYVLKFEMYTGAKDNISVFGATYDVVMDLAEGYLSKGQKIFMDNYHSSPNLFRCLHEGATLACAAIALVCQMR